jgi:flagellar hook protein FlgE
MSLSNTLFAGLSGLNANQTRLSVIGNNIANANSVAFKSTRSLFKPQFYVTDSGGSQPSSDSGGTNPSQRGLGVIVSALEKNFGQGSIETTGKPTDLALDGNGFFIVRSAGQTKYTRDGAFQLNSANQLVSSSGDFVQGYGVDNNFVLSEGSLINLTVPLNAATTAQATSNAFLSGNLNAGGSSASGSTVILANPWTSAAGAPDTSTLLIDLQNQDLTNPFIQDDVLTFSARKGGQNLAPFSFDVTATSTVGDLASFMQNALGIDATVPDDGIATTPVPGVTIETDAVDPTLARMVIAGNSGQWNGIQLTVGSLKKADGTTPMTFVGGTNDAGQIDNPAGESVHTNFIVYDSLGTSLRLDLTVVKESEDIAGTNWRFYVNSSDNMTGSGSQPVVANGTLSFGTDGMLRSSSGTRISLNRIGTGAATPLVLDLDFSEMTSFSSATSDLAMTSQDGSAIGRLSGFSIGIDGLISGTFSNGITRTLGQIMIATFVNPQGLVDRGANMFVPGPNSGEAVSVAPGALGVGKIVAGALELSNVDLSEEFINMIIASTGYSASSRVISATDQLVQELLNTAR